MKNYLFVMSWYALKVHTKTTQSSRDNTLLFPYQTQAMYNNFMNVGLAVFMWKFLKECLYFMLLIAR